MKINDLHTAYYAMLYYTGMSDADYLLLKLECAFAWANSAKLDEIVESETFWKWWQNQCDINVIVFANEAPVLPHSEAEYRYLFKMQMNFNANELYPQKIIAKMIYKELYKTI